MMYTQEAKLKRIQLIKYIVASRWFMHAFITSMGLIQVFLGVSKFNPMVFTLVGVTYSYNLAFYLFLRRDPKTISQTGLEWVSWLQIICDQLVYTVILYLTGGIESLSFLFYFITLFIAIMLFNEWQIIMIMAVTSCIYLGVICAEYYNIIPHFQRYPHDPGFFHNTRVTIYNSVSVVLALTFTSVFAAFVNNIIHQREEDTESERDKVTAIVNNLVDGVMLLDHRGRVMLVNPYAQRLLHVNVRPLMNRHLNPGQFSIEVRPVVEFALNASEQSMYSSTEFTIQEDDEHIIVQATALQVSDSSAAKIGTLVILRNITREKDLDQMKSDFISIAAHQLRTPLATLKWLFKLLLDGDGGDLSDKQKDLIAKGYQRNDEVIEIINNLLDVSDIEGGTLAFTLTPGSLSDLIKKVADNSKVNAQRNQVTLEYKEITPLPTIRFDKQKLKMAIQNLVDNAIKYSYANQTVNIEADSARNKVTIKVIDHGIGMSDETQEKLFTKFYRGKEAALKDPSGSGLGLYIVKNIIEKHGGTLKYESVAEEGTTFIITLPV